MFEFARFYRRQWKIVLAVVAICVVAATAYFITTTPLYRAQVTMQFQATAQQSDSLSSSVGIGLALVGLQGDRSMPERARGFGILKSRAFLLPFIDKFDLAPAIFPRRFDQTSKTWSHGRPPTQDDLHEAFIGRVMVIDDNSSTGLITLSIFLPSPQQSEVVANALINGLNEKLRADAIIQANENLEYLDKQLASSQIAEIRVAIAQLVQSEMKRLLLASGKTSHSFRVIDPASVPDRIYAPRAVLVVALTLLIALVSTVFVVAIRFLAKTSSE
jgi:uncharacterized protein involved in exopolysaccharide biosynthesis